MEFSIAVKYDIEIIATKRNSLRSCEFFRIFPRFPEFFRALRNTCNLNAVWESTAPETDAESTTCRFSLAFSCPGNFPTCRRCFLLVVAIFRMSECHPPPPQNKRGQPRLQICFGKFVPPRPPRFSLRDHLLENGKSPIKLIDRIFN